MLTKNHRIDNIIVKMTELLEQMVVSGYDEPKMAISFSQQMT